jgi:epoxyqueuosine reductase
MAPTVSMTQAIKAEAYNLGFVLAGVTRLDIPLHFAVYENWLGENRHAEMGYLATERARSLRGHPQSLFSPARSVLVLGIPYSNPHLLRDFTGKTTNGRVASYAWGQDYHTVIPTRLKALGNFITTSFGVDAVPRGFTDTAPVLERDFAQQAGLGWIGKNTCLINPRHGSYFLLSELFINLELESDPPFLPDRCGGCTRCIQACPTGCIMPDRTLDAGRCISYLTIEKKGPVDRKLRRLMGNWIFGCDICQIVCPWNERFAQHNGNSSFDPRPEVPYPDLIQELNLTPEAFNQKYRNSPVLRPHRRGYLRNVAIALGNSKDLAVLPVLIRSLMTESEPVVRGAAAWAIRQIGGEASEQAITQAVQVETDESVLEELISQV